MKKKYANCNAITTGTITNLQVKGQDFLTVITVEYEVGLKTYSLSDSIKLRSEKVKAGIFAIGQKRVAVMGNTEVGTKVRVQYDPAAPEIAFLPDNIGRANV